MPSPLLENVIDIDGFISIFTNLEITKLTRIVSHTNFRLQVMVTSPPLGNVTKFHDFNSSSVKLVRTKLDRII